MIFGILDPEAPRRGVEVGAGVGRAPRPRLDDEVEGLVCDRRGFKLPLSRSGGFGALSR